MASGAPAVAWEVTLDAGADAYVATLRPLGSHAAHVVVQIPRRVIDDAVLKVAEVVLEFGADGHIAAYAESAGMRTLTSSALSRLISEAVSRDAIGAEERPDALARLEEELLQALELVRQASRSGP